MEPDLRASTGDVAEFRSLGADIAVCSPANDFVYRSNPSSSPVFLVLCWRDLNLCSLWKGRTESESP